MAYEYKMKLTQEQKDILEGKQGEVKAKVMETIVRYGDMFEATELVKVTHGQGHLVTSFGLSLLKPVYRTMDELIGAGLKVEEGFTMDPSPVDFKNVKCNLLDRFLFSKILYGAQGKYEKQLKQLGLIRDDAFSCACYFDEMGNIPGKGDILSWAESSAVNYANSVLGARCNRNSGMIDIFGSIVGFVPKFGLLTDEGRKARWKVTVNTTKKPIPQILGSAIGIKVMEDVPYVVGLDKWIGTELTDECKAYLKDFGAATASNGAVGLYHIDKVTPEAKEQGETLLAEGYKEYVIDDAELERIYKSYPVMWKDPDKEGTLAFIGCPHLSKVQLEEWADRIISALRSKGRKKVACQTVLCTAPPVREEFVKTEKYAQLMKTGARVTTICPLMYTSNPLTKKRRIMTCSNKLRTYSIARYYKDDELLDIITGKED
ncbi:MAG: aconitase X catalytic domain-containing protein [Bacteroidales bacterium]|nr:aconitase X catalytic domain-containing protein [Bacteroidales bacterium]